MVNLVIDLGSLNTTIYQEGKGIVLKEPTVIIVEKQRSRMILTAAGNAVGEKVRSNALENTETIVYPVQSGIIVSPEAAELMLRNFLSYILGSTFIMKKINVIATIPCGLSMVERDVYERVFRAVGISETTLLESVIALSSLDPHPYKFVMVSGAQNTDMAIVGARGIEAGISVDVSGNAMSKAIMVYLRETYGIKITEAVAESLKLSIGSLKRNQVLAKSISGKAQDNTLKKLQVTAEDVRRAIEPVAEALTFAMDSLACMCSSEQMAASVYDAGAIFAGGVAKTHGLADYIEKKLYFRVNVVEDPLNAVVLGAAYYLNNNDKLNEVLTIEKK